MDGKSKEWVTEQQVRIREAFELFDKDKSDAIIQEEVGTVMRYLGIYPSERALVLEILPDMQDDEPTGFIGYNKFEKKVLTLLATKEHEPDGRDLIYQAFRTLDPNNKGFVSADVLEELLSSKGTPFRPKELEAFLLVAKDAETGHVYYEDYINVLFAKV